MAVQQTREDFSGIEVGLEVVGEGCAESIKERQTVGVVSVFVISKMKNDGKL